MKSIHRSLILCTVSILYIALTSGCGAGTDTGKTTAAKADAPAVAGSEIENGMGGADTGLPSERPDAKAEKLPELYYSLYTVKKGDLVGNIAKEHGVSQDAIISVNKLRNTRVIQIGMILKIPSINGIVYKAKKGDTPESIADKYRVSLESVALVNNITDNIVQPGAMLFLPDAKLDWVTIQEINGDLFHRPLRGGYYVSSRYGWRDNPFSGSRTFHNGMDMATARGTKIYAALDGTVSATGYDVTYGNYVIISHHSGYQTLYGHMNSILTAKGKYVTTASVIGTVGNTGQSTGPHLHFTVFKNHSTLNPTTLLN
jgi:murein DD-endopeptidase MepM/ murein hydrolase activator NlpD